MSVAAIIVAGGKGERAGGDTPKQLQPLGARPVFAWSVEAFRKHARVDLIVLVIPQGENAHYQAWIDDDVILVSGGASRTSSVRNGLQAVDLQADDIVLIHDAARPGIGADTISRLIETIANSDAAAPALPVQDAIKRDTPTGLQTVDRDGLYRIQTPQTFRFATIWNALEVTDTTFVDDLQAVEAQGGKVDLIVGTERLNKITYPGDLQRMSKLLTGHTARPRVGTGFDVHAFEPGTNVTLCGVDIPHTATLKGHSDADVAWHALTDAILGAAALGDIGDHFPPSEAQWKNADSAIFLRGAAALVRARGYDIVNCDVTVICEAPKVKPHREAMRARTAEVLGLEIEQVSVKATTTEGLGFTGRGEGIAAQASAVLSAAS